MKKTNPISISTSSNLEQNKKLDFINGNLQVYPNPSNGIFTIEYNGETESASISIFELSGKQVYTGNISAKLTNQLDVPCGWQRGAI
jgi:hypothetical protein